MAVAGGSMQTIVRGRWLCALFVLTTISLGVPCRPAYAEGGLFGSGGDGFGFGKNDDGSSSKAHRDAAIAGLPMQRLTQQAQQRILAITKSPTIYRRLPTQAIHCDRDMFLFLSRNPEVLVGMWDLMGITNVQTRRTGPYQMKAVDGSGTTCMVDLVYGDPNVHIFVAEGFYDGKMVAKPINGSGVFILTSRYSQAADGSTTVTGTIDCFLQLESLGADLVARTLSGLIGRSADANFLETARFIAQVSQASEKNPTAMLDVAARLPQVSEKTRGEFITRVNALADKAARLARAP